MSQSLLIYDGGTRLFRRLARWVAGRSDGLTLVPWRADGVRRFLTEQFGDHLFAFVMVDVEAGVVHAGGETVGRLLRRWGAPETAAALAERTYAAVGDPLGQVLHGRRPADVDGSFPLAETARPHVETLQATCSAASCAAPAEEA